jgi:hypothetical protein
LGNALILLAAAAAGIYQPQPVMTVSSGKSLSAFGSCFADAQERSGQPWAFVAADHGGSFTNEGAAKHAAAYRLQISNSGGANQLRLYVDPESNTSALVTMVAQCR